MDTHPHNVRDGDANVSSSSAVYSLFMWDTNICANRVMKAGRAESEVDSLASPAAAKMNGRAENCLHS